MIRTYASHGLLPLLAAACLTLPCRAATTHLEPALGQLLDYRFGQDRAAVDVVEAAVFAAQSLPEVRPILARQLAGFLGTDAPYDARQFACRQLALVVTPAEIPALAAALEDSELCPMVLYVLNRLPDPAVDNVLRQALPHAVGSNRLGIIELLGRRRSAEAAPLLIPLLQDANPDTVATAAQALGSIASPQALRALETSWEAVAPAPRPDLAEAVFLATTRLLAEHQPTEALRLFTRISEWTEDPHLLAAAFRGRVLADPDSAQTLLAIALRDVGSDRQAIAVTCVRELPPTFDFSALLSLLRELPVSSQVLLVQVLGDRRLRAARGPIQDLVSASEPQLRLACLSALGRIGDLSSLELLLEHAVSGPALERRAALASLATLGDPEVDPHLTQLLTSPAAATRIVVLQTLGQRGTSGAVPVILQTASDDDPLVRRAAHQVLRELAHPDSLAEMIDRLLGAPPEHRVAWVTTLGTVIDKMPLDGSRTTALLAALQHTADPDLRAPLLTALGQTGVDSALPPLESALLDPSSEVRVAALRQLAEWPNATPLASLRQVVSQPRSETEHTLALRGSVRMIALQPGLSSTERLRLYQASMRSATDVAEQRLVLSSLASLPTLEALRYVQGFCSSPDLRAEAELALASIARGTAGTWPKETRLALQTLLQTGANPTAHDQAAELLNLLDQLHGFVTTWEVSPAYSQADQNFAQLFATPFAPEQDDVGASVAWQPMPALTNPEQPWLLDLLALHGGEQRVAYLRTVLLSDRDQDVVLELGSDDGAKAWLNGRLIWENNTQRAVAPGQDTIPLPLRQGENRLLIKITQNVMGWGLCARICHTDRTPADDVRALLPN